MKTVKIQIAESENLPLPLIATMWLRDCNGASLPDTDDIVVAVACSASVSAPFSAVSFSIIPTDVSVH